MYVLAIFLNVVIYKEVSACRQACTVSVQAILTLSSWKQTLQAPGTSCYSILQYVTHLM